MRGDRRRPGGGEGREEAPRDLRRDDAVPRRHPADGVGQGGRLHGFQQEAGLIPVLARLSDWMLRSNTLSWTVGIAGFLLARDAAARLGFLS